MPGRRVIVSVHGRGANAKARHDFSRKKQGVGTDGNRIERVAGGCCCENNWLDVDLLRGKVPLLRSGGGGAFSGKGGGTICACLGGKEGVKRKRLQGGREWRKNKGQILYFEEHRYLGREL